jgi:hypothetical protein
MEFLEPPAHGFDRFRQGGGSAGEPDYGDTAKPFRLQFFRAFNVQRSFAGRPTGLDQLPRVVTLAAANNHDDLHHRDQFLERELSILRRFTNRIGKPNFCIRMCTRDFRNQRANPIDWLGCLRNNSVTMPRRKLSDVGDFVDDTGICKITNQTADLDVISQTDHYWKVASANKAFELIVRVSNEWASAVGHVQAAFVQSLTLLVGGPVRGNHHATSCGIRTRLVLNALGAQLLAHDWIMDQLTEDGERPFPSERVGLGDGVADAETDAEMFCDNNFHLLCITKSQPKFFYFRPAFTICSSTRRYS